LAVRTQSWNADWNAGRNGVAWSKSTSETTLELQLKNKTRKEGPLTHPTHNTQPHTAGLTELTEREEEPYDVNGWRHQFKYVYITISFCQAV